MNTWIYSHIDVIRTGRQNTFTMLLLQKMGTYQITEQIYVIKTLKTKTKKRWKNPNAESQVNFTDNANKRRSNEN